MTYLHPGPKRRTYKGTKRHRSISSKVTDAEYASCEQQAKPRTVSEWNRALILRELGTDPASSQPAFLLLAEEVVALRFVLLNALDRLVPAPERAEFLAWLNVLVKEADTRKAARVQKLLEAERSML